LHAAWYANQMYFSLKSEKWHLGFVFHFCFFMVVLGGRYIVAFAKVLTLYQINHI
jgi:hypothetical protein